MRLKYYTMEVIKKLSLFLLLICTVAEMDAQFLGTNNLYYQYANDGKTELMVCKKAIGYYTGVVVIPETAEITDDEFPEGEQTRTLPVTAIKASAFASSTGMTSVSIPANVKTIGDNAFLNCSDLKKAIFASVDDFCGITFGNKEANPLYYAHHLYVGNNEETVIDVPAGLVVISDGAFAGGYEITKITIPETVTYIGKDALELEEAVSNLLDTDFSD